MGDKRKEDGDCANEEGLDVGQRQSSTSKLGHRQSTTSMIGSIHHQLSEEWMRNLSFR